MTRFPSAEDGLKAVVDRAPQAEALAASWIQQGRPYGMLVYGMRRRIATAAVAVLAGWLFVHVMFGANGMVVYKQKRDDYRALRKKIDGVQQENDRYAQQIQGLKTDQTAIEREAREQLGYVKTGEFVYVPPTPAKPAVPANHSAKR